jgi:hypothetical protein
MSNFVQSTEYDVHMYAKFEYTDIYNRGRGHWRVGLDGTVQAASGLIWNQISSEFKSFQTFTDSKRTFPSSNILKQNMVVKVLKKGTIFSIGISSASKWILN